ncbi:ubiquitin carboxyl-terminal hydrolase 17-like protein 6 [Oryctolagus cuniculus]|uniref:ubiquitin carboxyl-terminal hydrolase 17-like protein 6 n=1 Tax=Oryctolagus cuniculus TaxID=9986 RepID=UPI00387A5EC3
MAASPLKEGKSPPSPQKELPLQSDLASGATHLAPSGGASLSCSWKRPYGIGAGLQNTGNTCYLNAALQCLTYTPPLANYMLSQVHSQSCRRSDRCILCAVETHFLWALHSPGDVIQPCQVLAAGFHTNRQEDAHEFLMFALDVLKAAGLPGLMDEVGPQEDQSPSQQIVGGHWRSQIQCLQCQGISETLDPYLEIALDIKTADSVEQALQHLVQPEELAGENAYHCATCLQKTAASKTLTLQSAGKVLLFVLKRFSDFTGKKLVGKVHYPECLDMRPYMSQQNGRPLDYVLYAVLVHVGLRCQSGHYFCYVKAGNGHWYKMDDAKVRACDITSVLNQKAYVLFYVQKSEFGGKNGNVSPGTPCPVDPEADLPIRDVKASISGSRPCISGAVGSSSSGSQVWGVGMAAAGKTLRSPELPVMFKRLQVKFEQEQGMSCAHLPTEMRSQLDEGFQ